MTVQSEISAGTQVQTPQIANHYLSSCKSISDVVKLINDHTCDAEPEMIAASYAMDGADEDAAELNLAFIFDAGAVFDYQEALKITKEWWV